MVVQGLAWWTSGYDSMRPVQGAWVRSLVRELDSTATTKDLTCLNEDRKSCVPQLRTGTAK